jgi:pilus assembly protein CpaC
LILLQSLYAALLMLALVLTALPAGAVTPKVVTVPVAQSVQKVAQSAAAMAPYEKAEAAQDSLIVAAGRSQAVSLAHDITKVSITDPRIADVAVLSRREVLVNGKAPGTTSFIVWTSGGRRPFDVLVRVDAALLKQTISFATGAKAISVEHVNDSVILSGRVAKTSQVDMAARIASGFAPKVINLLTADAIQQVQVDVHVLETSRTGGHDFGVKFGSAHTTPTGERVFDSDIMMVGETGGPPFGGQNLLTFGQLDRIAARLKFLVQEGKAHVLADPKLVAMSGGKATFLVGGEVPVPEAQQYGNVTVTWREYGVRLAVEPKVLEDGRIELNVAPEVSTLDFTNGVRVGQFLIPALSSRKASTQVTLKPGDGLIIGGLIQNTQTENVEKFPLLGEIPVLGELFKSRRFARNETELQILVTPKLI